MHRIAVWMAVWTLLAACASTPSGPSGRAALEDVGETLGTPGLKSIQYQGSGANFAVGQSATPGEAWPRFNVVRYTRVVDYETASIRDEVLRTQAQDPPRGGGLQPIRGEQRQVLVASGDVAWNVVGDAAVPAPIALAERQLQLWTTPHGVVKAAIERNAV